MNKFGYNKIAVLLGGTSAEREVSLNSGEAVYQALKSVNIDAVKIDANGHDLIKAIYDNNVDCCFIALHGTCGEDGVIQGFLDNMNIPYTGSRVLGSALAMDKLISKTIWREHNLLTPNAKVMRHAEDIDDLKFPLAVKPANQGSSIGITKVDKYSELTPAYMEASIYGEVMAEEWITGQELTVSIINGCALPSIWIEPKNEFYDYSAKYVGGTTYHCPSGISLQAEKQIQEIAIKANHLLKLENWARVDFILDKNEQFYLIEANTSPGMTSLSLVPQAAKEYGWSFAELIIEIIAGIER